jgi:hypothetical protein
MDKNRILGKLATSGRARLHREDLVVQSIPQRTFTSVWVLEAEVNNGGFSQYFLNSSAETAPFVVLALEAIGASETADVCERAIDCAFPGGLPADPQAISDAVADFTDAVRSGLNELDDEFFTHPNNLTDLLFAYVAQHPEEFGEVVGKLISGQPSEGARG